MLPVQGGSEVRLDLHQAENGAPEDHSHALAYLGDVAARLARGGEDAGEGRLAQDVSLSRSKLSTASALTE